MPDHIEVPLEGQSPSSKATRSKGRTWLRRSSLTATAVVATLVTGGASYLGVMNANLQRADLLTSSAEAAPKLVKGAMNIVILGSAPDARNTDTGKGDVVMVLHISQDRKVVTLLSFPRTTYVDIPGHGLGTLRSTFATGGAKLTVLTLEKLLNTRMDHAMIANYKGFTTLAQQLGSVTLVNPRAFSVAGFTFRQGTITLTGPQVMAYVAARAADKPGQREERQRLVVEASLQKGLSREVLSSPKKLNMFIETITSNVVVDQSLTAGAISQLALSLNPDTSHPTLVRAPLAKAVTKFKGEDVQQLDKVTFKELATDVSQDHLDHYLTEHPAK